LVFTVYEFKYNTNSKANPMLILVLLRVLIYHLNLVNFGQKVHHNCGADAEETKDFNLSVT